MATRFTVVHEGHSIEVEPESRWSGNVLRLFVDGELVAEASSRSQRLTVAGDDFAVTAWLAWHGVTIQRAELVVGDAAGGAADASRAPGARPPAAPIALEPAPGSRAARRARFAREHPALYAARHAAKGVGQVLLGLVGIGVLLRFLPDVPLPAIDLPSIPLPSVDLSGLPSLPTPPGWVQAIGESAKYWGPILAGVMLALREYDRRTRARAPDDDGGDERDGVGTGGAAGAGARNRTR